jgi:hypothetical protein
MDELGAKLDDFSFFAQGANATSDAIARLKDEYLPAGIGEGTRGGQTRHPRADHEHTTAFGFHEHLDAVIVIPHRNRFRAEFANEGVIQSSAELPPRLVRR